VNGRDWTIVSVMTDLEHDDFAGSVRGWLDANPCLVCKDGITKCWKTGPCDLYFSYRKAKPRRAVKGMGQWTD